MSACDVLQALGFEIDIAADATDQFRRAKYEVAAGENDFAAVLLDGRLLRQESRILRQLVFVPLDVNVGFDPLQQLFGGVVRIYLDQINEAQGGQVLRPRFFRDVRPIRFLIDGGVAGDGDNQQVTMFAGELEIADVARMNDVKAPVTQDDAASVSANLATAPASPCPSTILFW